MTMFCDRQDLPTKFEALREIAAGVRSPPVHSPTVSHQVVVFGNIGEQLTTRGSVYTCSHAPDQENHRPPVSSQVVGYVHRLGE
jgi:hypothetical protein